MAKNYKGSLSLDWFNKQKSILLLEERGGNSRNEVSAPSINWINKDEALFYEIVDDEGKGLSPFWVERDDLRVREARPFVIQKTFTTVERNRAGNLIEKEFKLVEKPDDDESVQNILIKGDNLLALNTIRKHFENRDDDDKVKCIILYSKFGIT